MRKSLEWVVEQYERNLFLAAFHICKDAEDAKDATQDAFLQYYLTHKEFKDEQHLRAWLFRVTMNKAKDKVTSFWNRNTEALQDYTGVVSFETAEQSALFETVMRLPAKYRIVIHLFYYEEQSVREIAQLLRISENNVKVRLSRGRKMLRDTLGEGW